MGSQSTGLGIGCQDETCRRADMLELFTISLGVMPPIASEWECVQRLDTATAPTPRFPEAYACEFKTWTGLALTFLACAFFQSLASSLAGAGRVPPYRP